MKYILEIRLRDFRCYADTPRLALNHVTVLAGANNSGKSAFLAAVRRLVSVDLKRHAPRAHPGGAAFFGPSTYLGLEPTDPRDQTDKTVLELVAGQDVAQRLPKDAELQATSFPLTIVATFSAARAHRLSLLDADGKEVPQQSEIHNGAQAAVSLISKLPIILIPERRMASPNAAPAEATPTIREELVEPAKLYEFLISSYCEARSKFDRWTELVSEFLEQRVCVELRPSSKERILIAVGHEPLRGLDDVGCGITEVMNFAQAIVRFSGGLLLYEEPELHLHPKLQRRLMRGIEELCTNQQWQAIVTTHSNHVLDYYGRGISVYSIENGAADGRTLVSVSSRLVQNGLLEALGVRPSSVLQANAVIWVEGPSDIIYLRFFLERRLAERHLALSEYAHFAFALFGGSLLRYLSATIAPIPTLVDLLSVHPKSFVIVDSDRTASDGALGKSYTRDFLVSADQTRVWVTKGREMENYLADEVVVWAASNSVSLDNMAETLSTLDRAHGVFSEQVLAVRDALRRERAAHDASDAAKPEFARNVVEMMTSNNEIDWLGQLDLKERIDEVISFIQRANGLPKEFPKI